MSTQTKPAGNVVELPAAISHQLNEIACLIREISLEMLGKLVDGELKPGRGQGEADVFLAVMSGCEHAMNAAKTALEIAPPQR